MVAVPSIGRASEVTPRRAAPEADATRDLYERYARQIYTYCLHQLGNREEAEDAVQSTFLNAFRGYQRGVDPEFESAWLYKIAQNVCLTRQRSSSRRRKVETASDLDAMQDYVPAHEFDADELINLPEALDAMPHQQRKALLLREWQGLSYKEIADELGLSQAAVETLLFRARRSLAAGLGEEPAKKNTLRRLRSGGDAGSAIAIVKSLVVTGGAKVATAVATVAATSVVAATPTARHAVEDVVTPGHDLTAAPAHHIVRARSSAHGSVAAHRVPVATPVAAKAPVAHTQRARAFSVPHARTLRTHAVVAAVAPAVHRQAPVDTAAATSVAPAPAVVPVAPVPVDQPEASTPAPSTPAPAPVQTAAAPPASTPAPASKKDDQGTKKNDANAPGNSGNNDRTTSNSSPAPGTNTAPAPAPQGNGHGRNGDKGKAKGNDDQQTPAVVPAPVDTPAPVTTTTTATTPPPVTTTPVTTTSAAPPPPAPQPTDTTAPPAPPSADGNGNGNGNGHGQGHRK